MTQTPKCNAYARRLAEIEDWHPTRKQPAIAAMPIPVDVIWHRRHVRVIATYVDGLFRYVVQERDTLSWTWKLLAAHDDEYAAIEHAQECV